MTRPRIWRERLIGVLLLGLVLTLLAAGISHLVPDRFGQGIVTQARMLDSLRVHLLPVAGGLAGVLALLGERRLALAGMLGAVLVAGALVLDYRARLAPNAAQADLSVLWFNVLESTSTPPGQLAEAIRASGADLVALAESTPMAGLPDLLAQSYPHRIGCEAGPPCGLMILSRHPVRLIRLRDLASGPERFARLVVEVPEHPPLQVLALHMSKPWYLGLAAPERDVAGWALNGSRDVPFVLMGDFNAAPWSRRLRDLEQRFDLRHGPRPVPTWPSGLGAMGVPIDHVLVRGGMAFVSVEAWGADLGSNHRGVLAHLAFPPQN